MATERFGGTPRGILAGKQRSIGRTGTEPGTRHPADFLRTSTEPSVSGAPGGFLCTGTDSRRRIGEPTEVLRDDRQDKNGRELEREGAKIFISSFLDF